MTISGASDSEKRYADTGRSSNQGLSGSPQTGRKVAIVRSSIVKKPVGDAKVVVVKGFPRPSNRASRTGTERRSLDSALDKSEHAQVGMIWSASNVTT